MLSAHARHCNGSSYVNGAKSSSDAPLKRRCITTQVAHPSFVTMQAPPRPTSPCNRAIVLRERTQIRVVGALIGVLVNIFFTHVCHVLQLAHGRDHRLFRMAHAARREAPKFIRAMCKSKAGVPLSMCPKDTLHPSTTIATLSHKITMSNEYREFIERQTGLQTVGGHVECLYQSTLISWPKLPHR